MTDNTHTHDTHGFEDHHHIKAKSEKLDPGHQADSKTKDLVWDLIQGKIKPDQVEEKRQPGEQMVEVPMDYVGQIAFCALKELKAQGCGAAFSVKRDPEAPNVEIRWDRPGGLILPAGMAGSYVQNTDCLTAFVRGLAPEHVGRAAAQAFLEKLAKAEGRN